MLTDLWYRLRSLFRRGADERELDDELRFHLEKQVEKHVRAGHSREEAMRLARLDLGGLDPIKEECRDARGTGFIDGLVQDVRYGVRTLRKSPGFTAVAVLTLTIGIAANTVLFSVVNGVLLHPLPYPDAGQLVRMHCSKPNFDRGSISYPNFRDWQRMNSTFTAMAVSRAFSYTVTGKGEPEKLEAQVVSSDFFSLLGIRPVVGRTFLPGEDAFGAAPVALIGSGLWQTKLGGSPDIVGQTLVLDGKPFTIVGVVPESLELPITRSPLYVPIGQWSNNLIQNRGAGLGIHGVGRLKPGVTIEQARADMAQVTASLAATYPDVNKGIGAALVPLEEAIVGRVEPVLLLLLGAVGFVLLIACVNVANLLLSRALARGRELAVRRALGASMGRLLRQLLTESLLISLAGGALGFAVAALSTEAIIKVLPATLPRTGSIGLDLPVLLFTAGISILAGILFGLVPAIKAARPGVHDTLKEGGRGATGGRHRAQSILVVVEVALALVLLVGAGLMVRTLARLWSVDPGFRSRGVTTMGLALAPSMRESGADAIRASWRQLDQAIATAPGVEATTMSWGAMPLQGDDEVLFYRADQPKPASLHGMSWALKYVVTSGYLDVMGIPLLRGRFLTARDDENAPVVVVVDDVFARTYFPGEDVLGKRIVLDDEPVEIVGVVGHVKQWGLDTDDTSKVRAQVYESMLQMGDRVMPLTVSGVGVIVRGRDGDATLVPAIRARAAALGADNVVFGVQSMDDIIAESLASRRFSMILLGAFAVLALILSSVGIYGVISYVVTQRTNEIGIRVALGAGRGDILRLVLGQGAKMAIIGVGLGVVAALALTRVMADLIYGVAATDPVTFVGVAGGLTLVALAASYLPARRAMRVDPMLALRHE